MIIEGKNGAALCASIGSEKTTSFLGRFGPFDVLFTDPPWGSGTLRYFQKAAGAPTQVTEKGLNLRITEIVRSHVRSHAFILLGHKQGEKLAKLIEPHVHQSIPVRVKYWLTDKMEAKRDMSSLKEATLVCVAKEGAKQFTPSFLEGFRTNLGYDRNRHALRYVGGKSLLDCCAGFGKYLKVGLEFGYRVFGVELSSVRFESLREKITGQENPKADKSFEART